MRLATTALLMVVAAANPSLAAAEGIWITHPEFAGKAGAKPVTLQFRRDLVLKAVPRTVMIKVSADSRFRLYVNGRGVAQGPARGDLQHWRYATINLAPFLAKGRNRIAAEVWNDGAVGAAAQVSNRTAFLISAADKAGALIETGRQWRTRVDPSHSVSSGFVQFYSQLKDFKNHYYSASPPETLDGTKRDWNWLTAESGPTGWVQPVAAVAPGEASPWKLMADPLPPMREVRVPSGQIVRASGVATAPGKFAPLRIAANSEAVILVDAGKVRAAFPELVTTGGRGAEIKLVYTEALYDAQRRRLTDRSSADGQSLGLTDKFLPDGGAGRTFRPHWFRVWRFVELRVKTGAEPLTIDALNSYETGYPFRQRAYFKSSDPQLNRIWDIGWQTELVNAHETFMDSAYWEETQYIGDTRIEALISYAVSGDPRLGEQALDAFEASRAVDGIPQGAWPVQKPGRIPLFGLLWVGMLHDYWMRFPDVGVIKRNFAGARATIDWYARYTDKQSGLISGPTGWQFIDWRPTLSGRNLDGPPPPEPSCVISLFYVGASKNLAELEAAAGQAALAARYRDDAAKMSDAIRRACWVPAKGLFADSPAQQSFSQQGNSLAIIYDVAPVAERASILDRMLVRNAGIDAPAGVTPVTYYFAYYLARAIDHAGEAGRYHELLRAWREMLGKNFTTWPEEPDPTRSDTHAWSAHPTLDLLEIVAGIGPASPGYRTVRIAPNLGKLTQLDAAAVHPKGLIKTHYVRSGARVGATITLPDGVTGTFIWKGSQRPLRPGKTVMRLSAG